MQFALVIITSAYFDQNLTFGTGLVDGVDAPTSMALATLQPLFDDKHCIFLGLYLPAAVLGLVWSALIVTLTVVDFFFYWLHRLGHSRRLFWLLWHRPHHMPSEMVGLCTMPVFTAFPLFIVFAIPLQVAIGLLSKLFGPEAMIMEALVLRLLTHPVGVHSHCSAFYEWYAQSRTRMFLGNMLGVGNYHYVHHSAIAPLNQFTITLESMRWALRYCCVFC